MSGSDAAPERPEGARGRAGMGVVIRAAGSVPGEALAGPVGDAGRSSDPAAGGERIVSPAAQIVSFPAATEFRMLAPPKN